VVVWRICAEKYAAETLTGRGGLLNSGRWHTEGRSVVYTSASLALAALEALVHVDRDLLPAGLAQVEIDVPDELELLRVDVRSLPHGWRLYPGPARLRQIGDDWLAASSTPVLQVPSAVIPTEANYLLNPQHPGLAGVSVVAVAPFTIDWRLLS
jgi:RES domain-containing protein